MTPFPLARRALALALAVCAALPVLSGCASASADGGFGTVQKLTRERTGRAPVYQRDAESTDAARKRVAELLAAPLSADDAVEIALLNHRGLQADFAELGIAEADVVRAGRLRNPSYTYGRLSGGGSVEIDRAVLFDVAALLTMPLAQALEQQRFEQAQLRAALDAVGIAAQARRRYVEAVAAAQLVEVQARIVDATDAGSELARRLAAAGNISTLARLREQSFHADALAALGRSRQQAISARERLVRALGLERDAPLLPSRLPELPPAPAEAHDAEQTAIDRRLDVRIARSAAESTARSLGLTKATRFVNVLEAGYQNQSSSGEPRRDGYEITLELPLFDFGGTRVARAEATYRQAMHRTAQVAAEARSQAREAHAAYRNAYELARHYRDEVVPLRKRISDETLLRYNGMLASVFELLADAREQALGVTGAVESLRDFWLADTDLQTALTGRAPAADDAR